MLLSVDIQCVQNHITKLRKEQENVQKLIVRLNAWSNRADAAGELDAVMQLRMQIQKMRELQGSIQQRILLLNSAADSFRSAKHFASEALYKAMEACYASSNP